jgi:DNA-directed RNA polymerase subunit M/transcription elongation factor TFIIS
MAANCPECDSPIDIDEMDADIGDELSCSECGSLIRVASDSPLELELADDEDDEDDVDDDEDDDEEEDDEDELGDDDDWGDKSDDE